MLQYKLWFLLTGIVLLVLGIAGNVYWTQHNQSMTKEQCFLINYWLYVGLSGLGLLLVLASALMYWWASRKGGSSFGRSQYGYGQMTGGSMLGNEASYGFGYFQD